MGIVTKLDSVDHVLDFVCFPWNTPKTTADKIAAWAAFFFAGWICYPLYILKRAIHWISEKSKIDEVTPKILLSDSIAHDLSQFNQAKVTGQIHGIYITTNEKDLEKSLNYYKTHPPSAQPSMHIGCAAWHNLDIISARKSSYGLIIDFNPKNRQFVEKTAELIQANSSRQLFKKAIVEYLNSLTGKNREIFFHPDQKKSPVEKIKDELSREGSWLESDENYLYVKEMVSKGKLIAITVSLTHPETFIRLRQYLKAKDISIDTLYLSNICNFMKSAHDQHLFHKSVQQLLDSETLFINCPKIQKGSETIILNQIVMKGKEASFNHLFQVSQT